MQTWDSANCQWPLDICSWGLARPATTYPFYKPSCRLVFISRQFRLAGGRWSIGPLGVPNLLTHFRLFYIDTIFNKILAIISSGPLRQVNPYILPVTEGEPYLNIYDNVNPITGDFHIAKDSIVVDGVVPKESFDDAVKIVM